VANALREGVGLGQERRSTARGRRARPGPLPAEEEGSTRWVRRVRGRRRRLRTLSGESSGGPWAELVTGPVGFPLALLDFLYFFSLFFICDF
jgi:hypothetical protein